VIGGLGFFPEKCTVEHGTPVVSTHKTIGNGYIFSIPEKTQGVTAFKYYSIVPWRIYGTIGNADIAATVDIEPIAVGIDFHVVDGQIVNPCSQQCKMSAMQQGDIADGYVFAQLQTYGLISHTGKVTFFAA
jgi:hypothetical protein